MSAPRKPRRHLVQIWRNPQTGQWNHRFIHGTNGRELSRQSQNDGVTAKATVVKSACTSYGLGEISMVDQTDGVTIWESSTRGDVLVRIEDHS